MKYSSISRESILHFVTVFYTKILNDDIVSVEFKRILGEDIQNSKWQTHIKLLCDFWETMILREDAYAGVPFPVHKTMDLKAITFHRWLEIFNITLDECYDASCHVQLRQVAEVMVKNFMKKLKL